jgi:hypothetical protein
MTRQRRIVLIAAGALVCAGAAAVAVVATAVEPPGAAPNVAVQSTESTLANTATTGEPATTIPEFSDGDDARLAAENLIASYIDSQFEATVSDVACSVPDTGDVGEDFVCYALKQGDLVIVLRATIEPDRLLELELILDQTEPLTTSATETTG